jgi:hypothetical protein
MCSSSSGGPNEIELYALSVFRYILKGKKLMISCKHSFDNLERGDFFTTTAAAGSPSSLIGEQSEERGDGGMEFKLCVDMLIIFNFY